MKGRGLKKEIGGGSIELEPGANLEEKEKPSLPGGVLQENTRDRRLPNCGEEGEVSI